MTTSTSEAIGRAMMIATAMAAITRAKVDTRPKNYKHSDARIQEDVNERLTDHPRIDATNIDVHVENGESHQKESSPIVMKSVLLRHCG